MFGLLSFLTSCLSLLEGAERLIDESMENEFGAFVILVAERIRVRGPLWFFEL